MWDFPKMRRLHDRGTASRGLVVDRDGVMLGPDCTLIRRTPRGYRLADGTAIDGIIRYALGDRAPEGLSDRLRGITRALDDGDLVKAQILGLQIPLDTLTDDEIYRLDIASSLTKAGFNPDQPRDDDGKWTDSGGASRRITHADRAEATQPSHSPSAYGVALPVPTTGPKVEGPANDNALRTAAEDGALEAEEAAGEEMGVDAAAGSGWGPKAAELALRLVRVAPGPVAFLGGVLIPTNESNIHSGHIPDTGGVTYRSDEGILSLWRQDADGTPRQFYFGFPDEDGAYQDDQGNVIGRKVGTGFFFNIFAFPDVEAAARNQQASGDQLVTPGVSEQLNPQSDEDDEEQSVCPPPQPENIAGRSERSLAYQEQITGLPRGFDVKLRGVRFDGCVQPREPMQEAKGMGIAWPLRFMSDTWIHTKWKGYPKILDQARRQSEAAPDREIEWFFAERRAADFFREEFAKQGFPIVVRYVHPKVIKALFMWHLGHSGTVHNNGFRAILH